MKQSLFLIIGFSIALGFMAFSVLLRPPDNGDRLAALSRMDTWERKQQRKHAKSGMTDHDLIYIYLSDEKSFAGDPERVDCALIAGRLDETEKVITLILIDEPCP